MTVLSGSGSPSLGIGTSSGLGYDGGGGRRRSGESDSWSVEGDDGSAWEYSNTRSLIGSL